MSTGKRGRPRTDRPETDLGTPELRRKRQSGETSEALDLCLDRGLIDAHQHACGLRFRWLYTLRYGVPTVQSLNLTDYGRFRTKVDESKWRELNEKDYSAAIVALKRGNLERTVLRVVIFNEPCGFLTHGTKTLSPQAMKELEALNQALDILIDLWQKPQTHNYHNLTITAVQ